MTRRESFQLFSPYQVSWSSFGNDIYRSAIVRSCIRPLAEGTSKLNVHVYRDYKGEIIESEENERLERMIAEQPNPYMNGKAFLYKVRALYEIHNNVCIFIDKDDYGEPLGFYPIPFTQIELRQYDDEIFLLFDFTTGNKLIASFDDVAILRKDYTYNLLFGESPVDSISPLLELVHTANEGTINTIKTSVNLRGILKSTKAIISDVDRKAMRDAFVEDYLNIENESGVAVLDSTSDYTPLEPKGKILDAEQTKEQRENIYRYFNMNDAIVMSKFDSQQWEAHYEANLEPFALDLSLEMTNKVYGKHKRAFGNKIVFAGNRLLYISTAQKLQFTDMVDRGEMTPNEHRAMFGLKPRPGGDEYVIRAEYVKLDGSKIQDADEGINQNADLDAGGDDVNE